MSRPGLPIFALRHGRLTHSARPGAHCARELEKLRDTAARSIRLRMNLNIVDARQLVPCGD